ncbi:TPA: hypothetical protein ACOQ34_005592 [Bacillus cereus]|uniref:hypothetical protein n=1 Tax=Bacillus cereus TaxID=1396 RepID=UPI001927284A|nr:hypothetical protein [Bacillus cereus]HEF5239031.1 hypothetical protein [Bacillus cereus]
MKKTLGFMLVMGMGISLSFSNPASAETSKTNVHNKLEVKQTEDGRVLGIKSSEKLSLEQLDNNLMKMGFSFNEISNMQKDLKKELVKQGGKKANLELVEEKQEYKSLDGENYIINNDNKEKIQNIKQQDANKLLNQSSKNDSKIQRMNPPSAVINDELTFNLFAIYEGTKGSDYVYKVYSNQMWTKRPYWNTTDTIGIVWESNAHAINGTESARQYWTISNLGGGVNEHNTNVGADRSSLYGTQWKLPYKTDSINRGAYTSQKITIPQSYRGSNATVGAAFAHPWFAYNFALNFGPGTIAFNDAKGDKWSLRYNMNVGS